MQPTDYPLKPDRLRQLWTTFVNYGELSSEEIASLDPAVWLSWQRCRPRFDPFATPRLKRLSQASLRPVRRAHIALTNVAAPLMEDIHQDIEGSDCAIILATSAGCVLDYLGDPAAVQRLQESGMGEEATGARSTSAPTPWASCGSWPFPCRWSAPSIISRIYHPYATRQRR